MSTDSGVESGESPSADLDDLEALGRELGEQIAELPAYRRFEEAKRAVEEDETTQAAIKEFEQRRQEFALARQQGTADEEALQELRAKQRELHSIPVMEEYLAAQEQLQSRLERLNEAISDPLVVDFGGEAGGCCHD